MTEDHIPALTRGTYFRFDSARGQWALLAPERVFVLDEIAAEVMKRVDGTMNIGTICDALATQFDAPPEVVLRDVIELMKELSAKGLVRYV